MATPHSPQALRSIHAKAVPEVPEGCYARVRAALDSAQYNDEGVTRSLGAAQAIPQPGRQRAALLRRTCGGTPLDLLVRLFILDQPTTLADFERAVAPSAVEDWAALGLVALAAAEVHPQMQLRCYQGMVFAYDFLRVGTGGVRPDLVMGVSPSSLVLASMTVRRPVQAALDVGSGCGIQALLAAQHSERVVGVDCNPRAVAMARLNAQLNGIANAEFRLGNMFEPVDGESFDLIVSNPPFIISPDHRHIFLNSGWDSDDVCRQLVRDAPTYLREDGHCILNANWVVEDGADWQARLAGWSTHSGCDSLVLLQQLAEPERYAASMIQADDRAPAEFSRAFDAWMDYYVQRHIARIGSGVIVMRRRSGNDNWFAVETVPDEFALDSGADVAHLLDLRTWLHGRSDEDLLAATLRLGGDVRLQQVCETANCAWLPASQRLRRSSGLGFTGSIDGPGAALLAGFTRLQPARDHIAKLAADLGVEIHAVTPAALVTLRRLVEQAFLEPKV